MRDVPRGARAPARVHGMASAVVLAAAIAYAIVMAIVAQVPDRALGHDEAVYAVGARGLVDGDPADAFGLHRSIGMRALAVPGVLAGGGERAVRLPFVLIAFAYLAAVYAIGRRAGGAPAGALAVAVQATSPEWQWRASEALSDLPSALCLLGLAALCADPRGTARAIAAGALAAAACYLRYASAPVVAAIFAVALVIDPARHRWLVGAAAAGAAFLAPFLGWSLLRTGSALGVLEEGERMARRDYPGHGLVFYVTTWPLTLAGPVMGAFAAIGIAVGAGAWRRAPRASIDPARRLQRLLAAAAVAQLLLLGWRVHGEARFVIFAMSALAIVACAWLAADRARWRLAVAAAALTAVPSMIWTTARLVRLADSRVPFLDAMSAIRADRARQPPHADRDCLILSTEVPMATWYGGCASAQVDGWGLPPAARGGAAHVYLIEARGLPRSIGDAEAATRATHAWTPIACEPAAWRFRPRVCVWRAATPPAPR